MPHAGPALLALLVLGCGHAEPFAVSDPAQDGPFAPGAIVRLTYGPGVSAAGWLSAGDTLILAARDEDRQEGDVCLFLLPATGGTRQGGFCSASGLQTDSVELFGAPAVSPERTVAFTYFHRRVTGSTFGSLRTGPLATPFIATEVSSVPFFRDGRLFQDITDLAWQPDGSLVLIAWTDEVWEHLCADLVKRCDALVRIPYGVMRASASAPGFPEPVAGGLLATSVTPDDDGGLFLTFAGSDTLWRLPPGGATPEPVHDFGPGSLVRGAFHNAGKVAVILHGSASFATDDIGVIQIEDGAGEVAVLDLASGTVVTVSPPNMRFRDPALSPDGRSVVAREGLIAGGEALWRISVP